MILPFLFLSFLPTAAPPPAPVHVVEVAHAEERIEIVAEITAYTSSPDETDETPEINAIGKKPGPGSLACPRRFDLGTVFVIQGKRYVCDDRMNKRYTNRFDIWMPDRDDALEFGIQNLPVEIAQ